MQQSAVTEPMQLPAAIREATGHFLNWIYNDVFHAEGGVQRSAVGQLVGAPGFAPYARVFYQWVEVDGGSRLTLGIGDDSHHAVGRWADTSFDRPPFSLLMRVWVDLCHNMGAISEGDWVDMDGPIGRARVAERSVYGDCW